MEKSRKLIAFPPGATVKEQLIDRGMNQKEFAVRMGMSEKHISKLINGEVQLTIDMARRLEMVLGLPTQFWLNLENIYREKIVKIREENAMDEDIEIAKKVPYEALVKNGWIADAEKLSDRVLNLRKYFEVAQLTFLRGTLIPQIACKRLVETEESDFVLITWVQKAKIEARKVSTKPIHITALTEKIPEIKNMTSMKVNECREKLQEILIEYGIALIFLPQISEYCIHGATFMDGNKIILGLADTTNSDTFWHNLFHELAHIMYGHVGKTGNAEEEKYADEFAERMLR